MKKLIVGVALLVLVLPALLAACGSDEVKVPAGAVAAVGSGVVTQEQFDQIWAQAEAQYKSQAGAPAFPKAGSAQYNQLKASIVNYLVQNQVIKDKAAAMKVTVTDKQFQDRIKQIIQQVGGQKKLDKLLKQQNVTQAQLEEQLKSQMLQDAVQQKVYAGIKVSQADIEKYFNNPANKSQFNVAESVDARHILVKTKAEAEKVRALLEADNTDANWKKVAKQYSTDTGSKNNGGSLGNFPKGRMVKPFETAAFSAQGQRDVSARQDRSTAATSSRSPRRRRPRSRRFAQAKPTIEQTLKYQKQSTAWESWLKDAMAAGRRGVRRRLRSRDAHGLSEPGQLRPRLAFAVSP